MNKNLIYRVLGALSSALIIVSVFVPFIKVTGYSQSLWQSNQIIGTLYLPILIIVFGFIGVIFFALNIKTEFAYATSGAVLFFILMRTMDVVNQNVFNTLSIGYYFLIIGAVSTGVMAFLCNMKKDDYNLPTVSQNNIDISNDSISNNQNNLYNLENQTEQNFQSLTNNSIPEMNPLDINQINDQMYQPISDNIISEQSQTIPVMDDVQPSPIPDIQFQNMQTHSSFENNMELNNNLSQPIIQENENQNINPVIQEFTLGNTDINTPNMSQVNVPLNNINEPNTVNPVIQEFTLGNTDINTPNMPQVNVPLNNINEPNTVNPVIQEFTNNMNLQQNNNNFNNVETDIFGQPINKN